MNQKLKAILIILAVAGLIVGVAAGAAYWVYSNSITDQASDYDVELSTSWNGLTVTLTATVTNPLDAPIQDAVVQFGTGTDAASFQYKGQATTDASGIASYSYKVDSEGTYSHIARYQIP